MKLTPCLEFVEDLVINLDHLVYLVNTKLTVNSLFTIRVFLWAQFVYESFKKKKWKSICLSIILKKKKKEGKSI